LIKQTITWIFVNILCFIIVILMCIFLPESFWYFFYAFICAWWIVKFTEWLRKKIEEKVEKFEKEHKDKN